MKKHHISKEKIIKIVSNSQQIEGYKTPSKTLQKKVKELMVKYDLLVKGV